MLWLKKRINKYFLFILVAQPTEKWLDFSDKDLKLEAPPHNPPVY